MGEVGLRAMLDPIERGDIPSPAFGSESEGVTRSRNLLN